MSNQKQNYNSKEFKENIQAYDNDDAYIFGELSKNLFNDNFRENNLNNIDSQNIPNKNIFNNFNEIQNNNPLNDFDFNYVNYDINTKYIKYNNENDINKNINNINYNVKDITFNKKFTINDIDSDGINNDKNNIKIKNEEQTNNINNNVNNNYKENYINNDDSNESNIPLVTLNFLSICQCCKDPFNSKDEIPFLFKCGHFFCKKCILEQFIDEEGIKCPNDGLVAKSISELKILNNFITDKTVTQRTTNSNCIYCNIHKGQKITHYIEETKELICIYCAFEKFKRNPNWEIKEISEKFKEIEKDIDTIIDENQKNVGIIQNYLNEIKKNKETEEKKVNLIFDRLSEIIKEKKEENLNRINTLFKENAKKLRQKLELFSNKIEKSEEIKEKIALYKNNKEQNHLTNILNDYNKLITKINDSHYYKLILQKYKFVIEDEPIIARLINKFGDFKIIPNNCLFLGKKKNNNIINNSNINDNINNIKNNLNYNYSASKLNINQSQSGMNINIFTNINQNKSSSALTEAGNIIKKKLKNNKSYSNMTSFPTNKEQINIISNSQYNSFYNQKMKEEKINEKNSNMNHNLYKNYKSNTRAKGSTKKSKLNKTLDLDINISKRKNNINNSTPGLRVNTPITLIKKNKINSGIFSENKFGSLNNKPNNNENRNNKLTVNHICNKNLLNKIKK